MELAVYIVLGLLCLMLLIQVVPGFGMARTLRRWKRDLLTDDECPKAAVVLVLRGCDPLLDDCIERLLDLDYPDYDLHIVVDHESDPAWEVVQQVADRRQSTNLHLEALREPLETCTLNCSSLAQAVSRLDESHQLIAFCDADTNPHPSWLRELATPLVKGEADIVTGQRWYMPAVASIGALVQYVWNAGTVVVAAKHSVWGGSFALTRKCLDESQLIDCWRANMGSDAMIYPQIRKHGFRLGFVPSVMMINRETCGVGGFFRWVQRQLFVGRLYLGQWVAVLIHGIVSTIALVGAGVLLAVTLAQGSWLLAGLLGAALGAFVVANLVVLVQLKICIRRIARNRNEPSNWFSLGAVAKSVIAFPLTQFVYVAALIKAAFMRKFEWRGVSYIIDGPWQVQLIEYRPFEPPPAARDELISL